MATNGREGAIVVYHWITHDLQLSGNDAMCYALVFGFCRDGTSEYYGSLQYLADQLCVRKHTALDILRRLQDRGLIVKREGTIDGVRRCFYQTVTDTPTGGAETAPGGGAESAPGGGAETAPLLNNVNNKNNNTPHTPQGATDGFEAFWEAYPNKAGKGRARTAWAKATAKGLTLEAALEAVAAQRRTDQWTREDGRYIPHPATWLNQERWEDEVPAVHEEEATDWW